MTLSEPEGHFLYFETFCHIFVAHRAAPGSLCICRAYSLYMLSSCFCPRQYGCTRNHGKITASETIHRNLRLSRFLLKVLVFLGCFIFTDYGVQTLCHVLLRSVAPNVSVCLFVLMHISETTFPNFTRFSVRVACGRDLISSGGVPI